jgi:hypothetical protein
LALILAASSYSRGQENQEEQESSSKKIILQYRVRGDAGLGGSGFVAVYKHGGDSWRLKIIWDIPEDEKKEIDKFIEELEEKQINGVEFECEGEWISKGMELRVKSLPRLTEKGKKRIRESGG